MSSNRGSLPKTMRAWQVREWGTEPVEALRLEALPLPTPGPGECLLRVQAIPLNLNDMERINGENMMVRPELPVTPGMEVLGTVVKEGEGVTGQIGQRVVAMAKQATGGFAEYALCPVVSAFSMPEDIPLPQAAALYFPYHLAWLGLIDRAELQKGETVLIHAAAGGAGSAALQLAKSRGARVLATCGGADKAQLCRDLGADVVIDYQEGPFKDQVLDETENRGVDVVFDGVGASVLEDSMACLAYNGRYLMMGFASDKKAVDQPLIIPRRLSTGNFKLCGVLLAYADQNLRPMMKKAMGWNFCPDTLGESIMREIIEEVRAGHVKPVIGETISFEELPAAMARLRDRKTTGRIIAQLDPHHS
ncbi:MAG: NADPH:quinone oxidoreductase family protein [Myxococcota bacterium]|nr:NADPH:quinone oxidoreductase family protein [Myxococcota bacterium]